MSKHNNDHGLHLSQSQSSDQPHPNHPVQRFKVWFLRTTALPFVDAVTILGFTVSVLSIAVAGWSLYLSIKATNDAIKSGAQQEQHTREAQAALDASSKSLETVTAQLKGQEAILRQSLDAAQKQEALLNRSTAAASVMVGKLDLIASQASAVPILTAEIACTTYDNEDEYPNHKVDTGLVADRQEVNKYHLKDESKHTYSYDYLPLFPQLDATPNIDYDCVLSIRNMGDKPQEHYKVKVSYSDQGLIPGGKSFVTGGPWIVKIADWNPLGSDNWLVLGGEKSASVQMMEGGPIAPMPRSDGDRLQFRLRVESTSDPVKGYRHWYKNSEGDFGKRCFKGMIELDGSPCKELTEAEKARLRTWPSWNAGSLIIQIDRGENEDWYVRVNLGSAIGG